MRGEVGHAVSENEFMNGPELTEHFATRIREMRKGEGVTLRVAADRAGISASHLMYLERGAKSPTLGIAARLADSFGIELARLLGDFPLLTASSPAAGRAEGDRRGARDGDISTAEGRHATHSH